MKSATVEFMNTMISFFRVDDINDGSKWEVFEKLWLHINHVSFIYSIYCTIFRNQKIPEFTPHRNGRIFEIWENTNSTLWEGVIRFARFFFYVYNEILLDAYPIGKSWINNRILNSHPFLYLFAHMLWSTYATRSSVNTQRILVVGLTEFWGKLAMKTRNSSVCFEGPAPRCKSRVY